MKRSGAIHLVLVTAAAAGMTACKEKPTRYCVDANNKVSNDWDCQDGKAQPNAPHRWYYAGGHGVVPIGTVLRGGSNSAPNEGFSTPSGQTVRGGIGEAGESAVGHGGGGEGGGE